MNNMPFILTDTRDWVNTQHVVCFTKEFKQHRHSKKPYVVYHMQLTDGTTRTLTVQRDTPQEYNVIKQLT